MTRILTRLVRTNGTVVSGLTALAQFGGGSPQPASAAVMDVPEDHVFRLTHACGLAQGTGGENVETLYLAVQSPNQNQFFFLAGLNAAIGANRNAYVPWSGEWMLQPGWIIGAGATWNAALQAKLVEVGFHGIILPRGRLL